MSQVNIQEIIGKYFNYDNGIFIEAGAADGIRQSNTKFLENNKNWTGILVEPNIDAAKSCVINREKSKVFNCALVDYEYPNPDVKMHFRSWTGGDTGLVTSVFDSPLNNVPGWAVYNSDYTIPARTLDSILEETKIEHVDFFSLDVEGYEYKVLRGFNFKKYKPKFMLIESHDVLNEIDKIKELLSEVYEIVETPTPHDYLFRYKD